MSSDFCIWNILISSTQNSSKLNKQQNYKSIENPNNQLPIIMRTAINYSDNSNICTWNMFYSQHLMLLSNIVPDTLHLLLLFICYIAVGFNDIFSHVRNKFTYTYLIKRSKYLKCSKLVFRWEISAEKFWKKLFNESDKWKIVREKLCHIPIYC